jgi:hypothetical protein
VRWISFVPHPGRRLDIREAVQLSRNRQGILVVLLFLATTAYYTRPLVLRLPTAFLAGMGDYVTEATMVAWYARQTLHDPLRLFQAPFYYPYSNTGAYQQSAFFTGLLAIPGLLLTGQPLLVTSALLVAGFVASGALGYLLAFTITGRVVPSLLAGAVFAYYPNRMDHLQTFTYQQAALFPLAVWALYRFLLGGRWRELLLLVATLWAQMLSSLYNGYALGFLLAGFTLAFLLLRPSRVTWFLAVRAICGLLLLAALLAPFLWPMWRRTGSSASSATWERQSGLGWTSSPSSIPRYSAASTRVACSRSIARRAACSAASSPWVWRWRRLGSSGGRRPIRRRGPGSGPPAGSSSRSPPRAWS